MPKERGGREFVYGLIGLALVLALGVLYALSRPASVARVPRASLATPLDAPEAPPASNSDGAGRMYGGRGPMSLGQFLEIVSEEVPKPLAEEFAYEFNADPELKAEWDRAQQAKEAPAADFLVKVGANPRLKALLSKFNASSDFRAAWAKVASLEDIDRVLNEEVPAVAKRVREERFAAAGRMAPVGTLARGPEGVGASRSSLLQAGAAQGGPTGLGALSGGVAVTLGGGARSGATAPIETSPASAGGATGSAPVSGGSAPEEHDATLFAALGTAGPDQNAIAFYLSLFGKTDPGLRTALEGACDAAIAANSGCEVVTLCGRVGMGRCRAACAAAGPSCTIVFPPDPPPFLATNSGGTTTAAPPVQPNATGYGANGEVYDNGVQVMTYGGQGPVVEGFHTGLVTSGDQVVGTFYTLQDVGGGVVRDASDQIIYTYDNAGNVTTCPCP